MHCGYFDTARKGYYSSFLTLTLVGGRRPVRLKFALKMIHLPSKTPTLTDFRLQRLNRKR